MKSQKILANIPYKMKLIKYQDDNFFQNNMNIIHYPNI